MLLTPADEIVARHAVAIENQHHRFASARCFANALKTQLVQRWRAVDHLLLVEANEPMEVDALVRDDPFWSTRFAKIRSHSGMGPGFRGR